MAHVIDAILTRQLPREHRVAVLEFTRAGYSAETGEFVGRTEAQEAAIRCLDCPLVDCTPCELADLRPINAEDRDAD